MNEIKRTLERPFPVRSLHWRVGATNKDKTSGIALAYITARDVMNRLDEAVGFDGWECEYQLLGSIIVCRLSLRIGATDDSQWGTKWVSREDGAGETQVEAEKGGLSDALKRSAVRFGVGRYLYALPNVWVPLEKRGNTAYLPDSSIEMLNQRLPKWV